MRVLGLDPGSRVTGFGLVERLGNHYRCLAHGVATANARLPLAQRLIAIVERVGEVLDQTAPDCVAVETAFYHENVRSALVLGHVRGALLVAAAQRGFEIAEYSPREIKLSVAGNGGAAKEQVSYMVKRLLRPDGTLATDAGDALAVALCHLNRAGRIEPRARAATAAARELQALLARRSVR